MKPRTLALATLLLSACEAEASGGSYCWAVALVLIFVAAVTWVVVEHRGTDIGKKFEAADSARTCLTMFHGDLDPAADVEFQQSSYAPSEQDLRDKYRDRLPADVFRRIEPQEG